MSDTRLKLRPGWSSRVISLAIVLLIGALVFYFYSLYG
jgi:hypothetical protein